MANPVFDMFNAAMTLMNYREAQKNIYKEIIEPLFKDLQESTAYFHASVTDCPSRGSALPSNAQNLIQPNFI